MSTTRYGYQPLRVELYRQRISVQKCADDMGVTFGHLRKVIIGHTRPKPVLREKLPAYLGVDLEDLFTEDILDQPYSPKLASK